MANTSIFNIATQKATVDVGKTAIYNQMMKTNDRQYHKSFDFSNVGMYTGNNKTNKLMRQFHQTRLYISGFDGMLHHTQQNGGPQKTYLISANLPESLGYKIGSKWDAPLSSFGTPLANALTQLVASKFMGSDLASGVNRAATMKIWGGSEPLSLSLKIPVIDDGYSNEEDRVGVNTNLVEALEFIGSLCLPKKGGKYGFYTPPPSPLSINIKYGKNPKDTFSLHPTYGRIMLQLGGVLLVDNCIIAGINVEYPNTKAMIRHEYASHITPGSTGSSYLTPLLAMVTLDITTVEALTAETFSNMLWLKHQGGEGQNNANLYEFFAGGEKQSKKETSLLDKAKNMIGLGSSSNSSNTPSGM